jgi:hypothetical protein
VSSIFVFGGPLNSGNLGETVLVVGNEFEDSGIVGAAYRFDFETLFQNFTLGAELGAGVRFGDGTSGEFWGGGSLSYRGLRLDGLNVIPTGVFGLSVITNTTGVERARAEAHGGDETLLFYLGLEIALSIPTLPQWEFVYRVHHRSGGYGALGGIIEGHNANVIGIRYYF